MNAKSGWTLATYISASRILLTIPVGWLLFEGGTQGRLWAVVIIIIGVGTDFLDGYLARRMHQVSDLGKILDPLADKIAVGALALFLVVLEEIPLWFVAAVVVRDALIVVGGLYIRRKKKIVAQSNMLGKITVNVIALLLVLATLGLPSLEIVESVLLWVSAGLMILSLGVYAKRLSVGRTA